MVKYAKGVILTTKFGGAFVGGVLVSAATSVPELVTEVAQAAHGTPAIGMADDIGANAFSTVMIAVVALFMIRSMFLLKLHK
jgi:cation:H+ antiporter